MVKRVASGVVRKPLRSAGLVFAALLVLAAGQLPVSAQAAHGQWRTQESLPSKNPGVPQGALPDDTKEPPKGGDSKPRDEKAERLTLERAFPEKSFFGPGARQMTFSRDGRFGAFLYRPWSERRHGADLYILDTTTGKIRRITSVGRMAEFEASARKVRDERVKKAKAAGFTLSQLAREQYAQLGWTEGMIIGDWEGAATTSDGASIPAGTAAATFTENAKGVLGCEFRIGLIRITCKSASFDRTTGVLKATVDDDTLKIRGECTLSLAAGVLGGDLVLTEPKQTLSLKATRKPAEKPDRKKAGPAGVVDAIGERLTLGDIVTSDDAEINDEVDGKPPKELAPRYAGVASVEWAPKNAEMLVMADGDIYRLTIDLSKWDAPLTQPAPAKPADPAAGQSVGTTPSEPAQKAPAAQASDVRTTDTSSTQHESGKDGTTTDGAKKTDGGGTDAKREDDTQGKKDDKVKAKPEAAADTKADAKKDVKDELEPVPPYRGELTRITRTREGESDVQYLPDGSGYTYLRGGALLRVTFGDSQIVQLDPELKDGETMVGYRISPDMKRLVFLANRNNPDPAGRAVTIVSYRERFAKARDVARHMPDDPWPEAYSSIYLYDLTGHQKEEGKLERVFTRRISGPRDVMHVPEWSPDSQRIAFAAFDQKTGTMKILEAGFAEKTEADKKAEKKAESEKAAAGKAGEKTDTTEKKDDTQKKDESTRKDDSEKKDQSDKKNQDDGAKGEDGKKSADGTQKDEKNDFKIENAKVVYEFLHNGGPNTPAMVSPEYLPDSRKMVFITEISGFRHLHMLDPKLEELSQVTHGQFEVYPFFISHDHSLLFATTTQGDPDQEHIYKIKLESGEMTKLSSTPGVYDSVGVREDGTALLAMHTDFGAPSELVFIQPGDQPVMKRLTDSHPEEAHTLTQAAPEYFTYQNRHGQTIYGHMFKPKDWTGADKRPLIIYVYGGPLGERKMATRGAFAAPSYFFARYMAETHGYVMATIDPRGASGYGAVFEKANFEKVGKPQTEDLVDGAKWLVKNHGVDEKRMGLHGWSFGGFQTQMVMYSEPDVFAAGIAGAGPTEWQNYNSWYSTGTIGSNEPGKTDLEKYSLLPLAKNLKGKLMLVHGMEDSNVLFQDTVRVYRELLKAKKEVNVELFLDPTGGHGLGGDVKTLARYRKFEDFFLRQLGRGEAFKAPDAKPAEPEKKEPAPK